MMYVWKLHVVFPILSTIKIVLILTILGSYFLITKQRRRPDPGEPIMKLSLLIGLWAAFSIPFALYGALAFGEFKDGHARLVLYLAIIIGSIRTPSDVQFLMRVTIIGGLLYTFQAIRFGAVVGGFGAYDANDLGTVIVATVPFIIGVWNKKGNLLLNLALVAGVFLMLFSLFNGGSRAGFLALLVGGIYLIFFVSSIKKSLRIGMVAVGFVALMTLASAEYLEDIKSLTDVGSDYNTSAESGRIEIWKRGFGYMMQRPIAGVGLANFPVAEGTLSDAVKNKAVGVGFKWSAAHNSFVQIGVELGVPGLLFFLTRQGAAMVILHRIAGRARKSKNHEVRRIAQAISCALVAFTFAALFVSHAYTGGLYLLLGLAAGLAATQKGAPKFAANRKVSVAAGRKMGLPPLPVGGQLAMPRQTGTR